MRVQMSVAAPWQPILKRLLRSLAEKGFQARATFDLQLARRSLRNDEEVACPHHGLGRCSCQYVVLQINRPGKSSSAVVIHGDEASTKVALLSAADEKVDPGIAAELCEALEQARAQKGPRTVRKEATGEPARRRTGRYE